MSIKTLLFIPVSSLEGIGEYTRSLIIAKNMFKKWPLLKIIFVLNRNVSYIESCPFEVLTTDGSATKDSDTVDRILENIKPDFVLFDASGRAANFNKAKALGAKVAFISQHKKKRQRGLKLNRLRALDKHWVVQPSFAIEPLTFYQRSKLKLFSKNQPENIGAVFERCISQKLADVINDKYNLPTDFFVFNVGSGGHKKSNQYCSENLYQVAKEFAIESGMHSVVISGSNYPNTLLNDKYVTCIKSLEHNEFIALLTMAKGRLVSAGDTLLQCIALTLPCVAVAVSNDQPQRLQSCKKHKLVLDSEFTKSEMINRCHQLLLPENIEQLIERMTKHQADDALSIIASDIARLIDLPR